MQASFDPLSLSWRGSPATPSPPIIASSRAQQTVRTVRVLNAHVSVMSSNTAVKHYTNRASVARCKLYSISFAFDHNTDDTKTLQYGLHVVETE